MEEKEYNWAVMNDNDYELNSIINHFNEAVNGFSHYSAEYEEKKKLYMQAIRVQCQEKCGHIFVLDDFIHMVDEGNSITFNNGIANLKVYMLDNLRLRCKNLDYPDTSELDFSDMMTPDYVLAVIDLLKQQKSDLCKDDSKWDEIRYSVLMNTSLNTRKKKRG